MDEHFDLFDRLPSCRTADELAAALTAAAGRYGFTYWMYALDLPIAEDRQNNFLLSNYPTAWIKLYFASEYLQLDPAIEHCHNHITPYIWPELQNLPPTSSRAHAVWRMLWEAQEFGLKSGLSIPLRGLGCDWGLLSLAASCPLGNFELRALTPMMQLLACYAHEAGHRLAHDAGMLPPPTLTHRELECLHWATGGHTSREIGQLIGVSERTVVFHLTNAAHKLGVFSRQSAIAKAIALGLVTLTTSVRMPLASRKSNDRAAEVPHFTLHSTAGAQLRTLASTSTRTRLSPEESKSL